ncbi:MAG: tetratricopeptide repeat protein [Planctomycetes bacterium]|nr:tetratricopeptide repeat protein [Planctomycetota bacterium]
MKHIGRRLGPTALVISLASSLGCQHSRSLAQPTPFSLPSPDAARSPALTGQQAAEVWVAIGRSLEQQGQRGRAMDAYRQALAYDDNRADVYARLAIRHDLQGEFQQSAELYRKALERSPDDSRVYSDLGYSLYLQGRWSDAERILRRALELRPDDLRARNNLGLVLASDDRIDEAVAEFRRGGCTPSDAYANVAFVLIVNGQWEEAREHYELALRIDPTSQPARTGLRKLNALIAKATEAGPLSVAQAASQPSQNATSTPGLSGLSSYSVNPAPLDRLGWRTR